MSSTSLSADVRGLAAKSLIYGVGSAVLRSVSLLVLPLYTRFLTPSDYGIVALAATLTALLGIVFPLGIQGAIAPFYFTVQSENRKRLCGTIWLTMVIAGLVMSVALDMFGGGVIAEVFPRLPFSPYVRLALWTAFFAIFGLLPLNVAQLRERANTYVMLTAANTLLTVALVVLFVVVLHKGAYGYLLGGLIANAALAIPFAVLSIPEIRLVIDRAYLKSTLAFGIPLIPHGLASWALSLSDRAILQRYVSLSELGLYSLGYQVGSIMIMAGMAIANAWNPFLFRRVAEQGESANEGLSRLVTYYTITVTAIALVLCLFAKDLVLTFTAPQFHAAYPVVPVIVLAYLWNSLYVIPAGWLFVAKRTGLLPIATVTAALLNVTMNVLLVPIYGKMAAAWSTFAAFLLLLILVFGMAEKSYPFPYDYRRLAAVVSVGLVLIGAGMIVERVPGPTILWKIVLLVAPAAVLLISPFFTIEEKAAARRILATVRWRRRVDSAG